jgi:predicted nucleotidyltransferase
MDDADPRFLEQETQSAAGSEKRLLATGKDYGLETLATRLLGKFASVEQQKKRRDIRAAQSIK